MLAKSPGFSSHRAAPARTEDLLPRCSEGVLELLRQLIAKDQVTAARRLLDDAGRRFPDDAGIRLARRVLAEGTATSSPFVQPTATAEVEWLNEPPEEVRGKWVALIGSQLLGMADSADELMASLRSKNLQQLPVVQYIAP